SYRQRTLFSAALLESATTGATSPVNARTAASVSHGNFLPEASERSRQTGRCRERVRRYIDGRGPGRDHLAGPDPPRRVTGHTEAVRQDRGDSAEDGPCPNGGQVTPAGPANDDPGR